VGIAITPADTRSASELLSFADLAMYSSKQAGKARCMFFDKVARDTLLERNRIETDLRQALRCGELLLHYQPKFDTRSLTLHGVEALVRWQHPTRGLLAPGAFIDVAEQVGLMAELGRRVLDLAMAQCRAWLDEGLRQQVAVNVSPSQFADPQFVQGVLDTLAVWRVEAELLSIEITESMAMTEFATTAQRLTELRQAGVRVAIDDFGIGFSNLSQLAQLPMDELKIDRSLISQIGRCNKTEAIIRAIVGMTAALGYRTIAEGIETPEQLDFVRSLGCDSVQGFLLSRPVPASAVRQRVDEPALSR
jgi:EAL domain-containing protein (putative c-di-GMP-specific phosphodiesterase class I)